MKTILIIDDEKFFCEAQARFFRSEGFHVLIATGGNKGLSLLKENRETLVRLAENLLERESLDAEQIDAVVNGDDLRAQGNNGQEGSEEKDPEPETEPEE